MESRANLKICVGIWYWDIQQAMIALFRLLQAAWILALILLKLMYIDVPNLVGIICMCV